MYNLTDFSLKELRILDRLIVNQMTEKTDRIEMINKNLHHKGEIKEMLLSNANADLPELREMHVRVLTSIAMKKDFETVTQN